MWVVSQTRFDPCAIAVDDPKRNKLRDYERWLGSRINLLMIVTSPCDIISKRSLTGL
jgi:hypothetical protein